MDADAQPDAFGATETVVNVPLKNLITPAHMCPVALGPRDPNTIPNAHAHSRLDKDDKFYLADQPRERLPLSKQPAFAPGNQPSNAAPNSSSKKRKIAADEPDIKAIMFPDDAPEIDEDDPRLQILDKGYTCQMVRKKVRAWIDSGAQKVGEFQKELGISSASYANFMNKQGIWAGEQCDLYLMAAMFFRKRELQGLPLAVPKPKAAKKTKPDEATSGKGPGSKKSTKTPADILDVSGVELPGEEDMLVEVFDTCAEMRKHIRDLQKKGCSQAAICRAFSTSYPEGSGKSVSAANLRTFMGNKGSMGGNTSPAFYGGYVFFEKKRIKEGKPKSKFREEMEEIHDWGVDVKRNMNGHFVGLANRQLVIDKYGKMHSIPC